ncbi:DUF5666 domain-containing protein [Marinobacter salexigens]|uniref:DUF5666 domain-containing protein n=1 Tax=Marinobacter salexigens TaxID=1925763 RepID=A0ABS6A6D5_9GAMM|nr:DUF5666 domain-containing protein [Marinobacter salexigens]MBU2873512.1 hypothetical protein [Marinobacter salexigens]
MKHNLLASAVKFALTGALASSLIACGGSGSESSSPSQTSSGTSVGPISGFGSVYVNGTRFRTDGTVLSSDGVEREGQLDKGMILKVQGDWGRQGEGEARVVSYDDTLRGPVNFMSWDADSRVGEINMLGQTVIVDGQTVFRGVAPVELASRAADYRVRISGWRTAEGKFRASYVGVKGIDFDFEDANDVEIEGVVENLDKLAQTFTIRNFPIDYTSAQPEDGFDLDILADGMTVEVEGTLSSDKQMLLAAEIDKENHWLDDEGDDVEISGDLYDYDEANRHFYINGVLVRVTDKTEFDDIRENSLLNGMHVQVEGEFREGVLYAEDIEGQESNVELEGAVESIDFVNERLMVGGVKVQLTASTLIDEGGDDERRTRVLDIQSFNVGDYLEVEGFQRDSDGGYLEANSVKYEGEGDDDCAELEARITVTDSGSIHVMNLEILPGPFNHDDLELQKEVELEYCTTGAGEYALIESPDQ